MVDGKAGSSVVAAAAAGAATAAASAGTSVRVGVGIVAGARVGTLDLAATALGGRSEFLEGVARAANIGSTRDIEGTLDVVKRGELDTTGVEC
jgi:hypothetical protein